jgi:nicotinamidase-related amidase
VSCRSGLTYRFDPASTALLVIDMQRDFLDERGMCAVEGDDISALRAIMPTVGRVVAWARDLGMTVIHTREGYAPDFSDVHALKRDRDSVGLPGPLGRFLIRGEAGHDFMADFLPRGEETVVDKPGFSAFYRTGLDDMLERQSISHLVIVGITTQCCVLSTIRSAVDRGYRCLTIADACAALEPSDHEAALATIAAEGFLFGWICDSSDLIRA